MKMSTGKELPRRNCPSPDSCGWSKKEMLHFHCPRAGCKFSATKYKTVSAHIQSKHAEMNPISSTSEGSFKEPDGEEGQPMNTIDNQKTAPAKSEKEKKKKKNKERPKKARGDDDTAKQSVANEKGRSPSSVTKDDEEARHRDSDDDQKTSTAKSKKKKKKKSSEKVDGKDETISQTVSGLDVANEECLKIPLQDGNPSSSSVTKDDEEAPHRGSDEEEFTDNEDPVTWTSCDLAGDLNSQPSISNEYEAFHNDWEIDWFHPSIASNSVWPSDHESYEAESEHSFFSSDEEIEISCESIIVLDELLLDILKVSSKQSMKVERLEKEVFDRTGCNFSTLHDNVKETELGSHGLEDFIENDSKYFVLIESRVHATFEIYPYQLHEEKDQILDISNDSITSDRVLIAKCLEVRNARSIVLRNSTIKDEYWPFGVLDLLLWFCPLLKQVDLTGCWRSSRSHLTKTRSYQVIDYLDPSFILNSSNPVEKISDMLSSGHSFPLNVGGWSILHSAILMGSKELVEEIFTSEENIGFSSDFHQFQTSLELAIVLHRCDIIELFKEKIHFIESISPSRLIQLCFLPQHGIRSFDHPVEILTSNEDTLQIIRNLHDRQDCSLIRLFQIFPRELGINGKELLKSFLKHLEEYTGPDSRPAFFCWNEKEICEAVQTLFKETGCSTKEKMDGFPYLMFSMPNVQLAKYLIQEGAQVDEKDQQGRTCLFHATEKALQSASPESWNTFVNFLLQNGANVNARNDLSETPLLYSLSFRCSRCYLCSRALTHDTLFPTSSDASGIQGIKVWRILLEAKARPNVKDEQDRSLLHILLFLLQTGDLGASEGLQMVCNGIATLQEYGFEINSRDTEGNTALHLWANLMHVAISDETIKIGTEIGSHGGAANSRNDNEDTPFHILMRQPFLLEDLVESDQMSQILALGMNLWIANCDGKCPFEVLLENESFTSAFTLLKVIFEDDQNRDMAESARCYRNQCGDHLLHKLCIVNNERALDICEYLLDHECDVNAQNKCKQTPLHLVCNKLSKTDNLLSEQAVGFIRLLKKYNADLTLPDVRGNTCEDMLSKCKNVKITKEIKWISESIEHNDLLSEVVRGENFQKVENYHYHIKPIGKGTFSCVFPAVDNRDGREVALKRLEKARLETKGDILQREVKCLLKSSSCSFVVHYIACARDSNFEYIVVELMEGSLDKYLSRNEECILASTICSQIAVGLEFLHQCGVLHRDLKPQNILYQSKPNFIVKISDFGLSKFLQQTSGSESVMHSKAGTRCWMAPELLVENPEEHSKATDIYSCGLLFHYVMSGKKHPFNSSDESLMSNFHEIEENIQRNKIHLWCSLSSEAVHLITEMLSKDPDRRPTASSLLNFPFFWDDRKKVEFLKLVGNQKEFEEPTRFRLSRLSGVERDLEMFCCSHFRATSIDWVDKIRHIYNDVTLKHPKRRYDTRSAVELVRFIRNSYTHPYNLELTNRKDLLQNFVVLKCFPYLVTELYKAVKGNSSWTNRRDLKHFFKK